VIDADTNSFYRSKGCRDLVAMGKLDELSQRELGTTWNTLHEAILKLIKTETDEDVMRFAQGIPVPPKYKQICVWKGLFCTNTPTYIHTYTHTHTRTHAHTHTQTQTLFVSHALTHRCASFDGRAKISRRHMGAGRSRGWAPTSTSGGMAFIYSSIPIFLLSCKRRKSWPHIIRMACHTQRLDPNERAMWGYLYFFVK